MIITRVISVRRCNGGRPYDMSKRSRRLDDDYEEVKLEVEKRFVNPSAVKKEVDEIFNLLQTKLDDMYNVFIRALEESRYSKFMIEGEIGKFRQWYYKPFYEEVLSRDFKVYFIQMCSIVRKVHEGDSYLEIMSEIFPSVFKQFITSIDDQFLGNYITHTNSMVCRFDDYHRAESVFVIKNNQKKRLLTVYNRYGDNEVVYNSKGVEIASITRGPNKQLYCLGFNNDLYQLVPKSEDQSFYALNPITQFLDEEFNIVDFKAKGIKIKALFDATDTCYLLTTDGNVYIIGVCTGLIDPNAIERIGPGDNILGYGSSTSLEVKMFYPIKIKDLKEEDKIVYYERQFTTLDTHKYKLTESLIDASGNVYRKRAEGFTFKRNLKAMYEDNRANNFDYMYEDGLLDSKFNYALKNYPKRVKFRFGFANVTADLDKEFLRDNVQILMFDTRTLNGHIYVACNNGKIYEFTAETWTSFKMVSVLEGQPQLSGHEKFQLWIKDEEEDTEAKWSIQSSLRSHCDKCSQFKNPISQDQCINGLFCDTKCQSGYYYKKYNELLSFMTNKHRV